MNHQAGTRVLVLFTKPTWPAAESNLPEGPTMQKGTFLHPEHLLRARGCVGYWGETEQTEGGRPQNKTPSAVGQGLHQGAGGYSALASDGETIREGSSEEVMLKVGLKDVQEFSNQIRGREGRH